MPPETSAMEKKATGCNQRGSMRLDASKVILKIRNGSAWKHVGLLTEAFVSFQWFPFGSFWCW